MPIAVRRAVALGSYGSGRKIHALDKGRVSASWGHCQEPKRSGAIGRGSEHGGHLVFPPRGAAQALLTVKAFEAVAFARRKHALKKCAGLLL